MTSTSARKAITVAVAVALMPIAAPAHADTDEDVTYANLLQRDGIPIKHPERLHAGGIQICAGLEDGMSVDRLATELMRDSELLRYQAEQAVVDAEDAYCPDQINFH